VETGSAVETDKSERGHGGDFFLQGADQRERMIADGRDALCGIIIENRNISDPSRIGEKDSFRIEEETKTFDCHNCGSACVKKKA
jgi:hypothetical protein